MTKKKKIDESELARSGAGVEEELEELELLTRRAKKLDLASRAEIVRAAELLKGALDVHGKFVAHLTALTQGVGAIRDRQNAAVEILQEVSTALDAKRQEYAALEDRFGHIGAAAREIDALMKVGVDEGPEAATKRLGAAIARLSSAADEASVLVVDARAAGFPELERQADATRQQLTALVGKLEQVQRASGSTQE